ncbi:hypothetical protein KMM349_03520 [Stenotrophomonas maltophilia]|nr:hypothetical protein KMM349_03520 [Stenotrophomonas maltophilia]
MQQPAQLRPQEVHQQPDQQGDGARFEGTEQAEVQGKVHRVGNGGMAASVRVSAGLHPAPAKASSNSQSQSDSDFIRVERGGMGRQDTP